MNGENQSFSCEYISGLLKVNDKKLEAIMAWIFKFLVRDPQPRLREEVGVPRSLLTRTLIRNFRFLSSLLGELHFQN